MNRSWINLVIIAILTIVGIVSYQFYISLTGQNVDLNKPFTTQPLVADLGEEALRFLATQQTMVKYSNSDLDTVAADPASKEALNATPEPTDMPISEEVILIDETEVTPTSEEIIIIEE
jgi:hypothetical protein